MAEHENSRLHVYMMASEGGAPHLPEKLDGRELELVPCPSAEALLNHMTGQVPDVVLMDVRHATGRESLLERLRGQYQDMPVIVLGEGPSVETVVECVKKGAEDFVLLSAAAEKLPAKILTAAQNHRLLVEVNQLLDVYNSGGGKLGGMVGVSPSMHEIYATIKSIAPTDATVLITGESGTGKEMVAEAIHALSALGARGDGEFVAVNCAAIPKDLLESELFGHEKGSFTGADKQRIGSCERADGGTLFLDEICEMNIGLQSKLLRFLQNHSFVRVGGTEEFKVDTRVIAATNREPLQEIERGTLRNDLYYRLNVVPVHLLPLRERPEDIPVLAAHFLRIMSEKYQKYFIDFSPETMRLLLSYPWPGNVRELSNTLERIVVLATSDRVTPELLPERVRKAADGKAVPKVDVERALSCIQPALQSQELHSDSAEVLPFEEVEKRAILGAIKKCSGDISKAARKLGLSRATLYRKLDRYGVK
jgi:two-component system repressor protein LuxO